MNYTKPAELSNSRTNTTLDTTFNNTSTKPSPQVKSSHDSSSVCSLIRSYHNSPDEIASIDVYSNDSPIKFREVKVGLSNISTAKESFVIIEGRDCGMVFCPQCNNYTRPHIEKNEGGIWSRILGCCHFSGTSRYYCTVCNFSLTD